MEREIIAPNRKALLINLDDTTYGTFAEIGGGQEVARTFFQAGGASGTVAKTISAYDKSFSDYFYNDNIPGRHVSETRLIHMLDKEYSDLLNVLENKRPSSTRYFVFANTVAIINFLKNNFSHGWLGFRFQLKPDSEPNDVIMHVTLHETDPHLQQASLGIIGVNLMFACYNFHQTPNTFLRSLMDSLSPDRIEITMIRMRGPDLEYVDNRLLGVQLVKNTMTQAIMFDRYGNVQQPSDMLYKKNVLAFRGSFKPMTYVGLDMLKTSYSIFKRDPDYDKYNTLSLCEMTINNLLEEGELDEHDFLDRVDLLNSMGQNVMVSNFREYYRLVEYFSQFDIMNLRIVIGVPTFIRVLEEKWYRNLKGGILEAFGKLFMHNMKLYVYPALKEDSNELITSRNIPMADNLRHLYEYLIQNRKILEITNAKKEWLSIYSHVVLDMIRKGDKNWEKMVPVFIANYIKKRKIFGYKD